MLFNSPTQFIVLLLMLVIGWLFGLASHPGGKKWKRAYKDEQTARAAEVAERDTRIRELEAANAELIKERDTARTAIPAATATAAATAPAAEKGSWFGPRSDDLTRLRGVDAELARRLDREGVGAFAALAALSDQDETTLERRIDLPAGFIRREQLREQAVLLAEQRTDEFKRRFG